MNILWPKETQWQSCNYQKAYFNQTDEEYTFGVEKRISPSASRDCGLDS